MAEENKDSRTGIINAVSKPIQLAALVVLVVEALLAYLLSKANANDITLYVWLMVGTLVLTIMAVFFIQYQEIRLKHAETIPKTGQVESAKKDNSWDVFLAAPMAALSNDEFKSVNAKIIDIKKALQVECNFKKVFYYNNRAIDSCIKCLLLKLLSKGLKFTKHMINTCEDLCNVSLSIRLRINSQIDHKSSPHILTYNLFIKLLKYNFL